MRQCILIILILAALPAFARPTMQPLAIEDVLAFKTALVEETPMAINGVLNEIIFPASETRKSERLGPVEYLICPRQIERKAAIALKECALLRAGRLRPATIPKRYLNRRVQVIGTYSHLDCTKASMMCGMMPNSMRMDERLRREFDSQFPARTFVLDGIVPLIDE